MARSFSFSLPLTLLLSLLLLTVASATKPTVPIRPTDDHPKRCVNIGSWFEKAGPFEAELGLLKYSPEVPVLTAVSTKDISRTPFNKAFRVQRSAKTITFSLRVAPAFRYTVTTAHAEIVEDFCKDGARVNEISVNGDVKTVDVFKTVGCLTAAFVEFKNVKPTDDGVINVVVKGVKGPAAIAGICVSRTPPIDPTPTMGPSPSSSPGPSREPTPSTRPTPSSTPRPSKSSTPAPSRSSVPAPSRSSTPAPSRSSTPAPSRSSTPAPSRSSAPAPSRSSTPAPSRSNIPRPTPSNSPVPSPSPPVCTQPGCMNIVGHADYKVIGNSMSVDEDRDDCTIMSSSKAWTTLPEGAIVTKAVLYWSASGQMTKTATANLNRHSVTADRTYFGGSSGYHFYGAEADVTHLVQGIVDFTVSGIWYDNRGILCEGNAAYAAWTMVLVYEVNTLPLASINVCTENFKFTFPEGVYSNVVDCIPGTRDTVSAKTTVVTFESDNYKGEQFFINDIYVGDNLFKGSTAPNLDIISFDITGLVRMAITKLTYTIKSYFVRTQFGGAVEGLFMPVRVTYLTLPH